MEGVPNDPRGDKYLRPHEVYEPGVREQAAARTGRAPEARGGTAAAFGFVLSLVALAGLWLDRIAVHSGAEAAVAAAAVAAAGLAASLAGLRAARSGGATGRGALACAVMAGAVLVLSVVLLVRA